MDRFGRCALLRDLEFRNLLLAGIASRIRSDGGCCALGLEMMLVGFGWVVMDGLDEGVRVDLWKVNQWFTESLEHGQSHVSCERHFRQLAWYLGEIVVLECNFSPIRKLVEQMVE